MIKAMNEVQALHDIIPKRRRSIEEKLLIVLIVLVLLAIGALVVAMVYPEAIKDFVPTVLDSINH